eukprot:scaffold43794_cov71-Phaeocystis_antarctica.AAC.2
MVALTGCVGGSETGERGIVVQQPLGHEKRRVRAGRIRSAFELGHGGHGTHGPCMRTPVRYIL